MRGGMIPALATRLCRQKQALLQTRHPRLPPSHLPHVKLPRSQPPWGIPVPAVIDLTIIPDLPPTRPLFPSSEPSSAELQGEVGWHLTLSSGLALGRGYFYRGSRGTHSHSWAGESRRPLHRVAMPASPGLPTREAASCKPAGMVLTHVGAGLNPRGGGLVRAQPLSPASLKSRARK